MLEIYVISLDRSDRWPAQEAMLARLGLAAHRWPAVDGRAKPLAELESYWIREGVLQRDSDLSKCTDRDDRYKQSVIGLMASTALLWRHLIEQDQEWTLILEDDCELHPNFADPRYFDALWSFLPEDAEFVYFGSQMTRSTADRHARNGSEAITAVTQDENPFFARVTKCIFGTHAYAIRKSLLPTLMSMVPFNSAIDNFSPTEFRIYALKSPCDWWKKLDFIQEDRLFWGVAVPRSGKSTITD